MKCPEGSSLFSQNIKMMQQNIMLPWPRSHESIRNVMHFLAIHENEPAGQGSIRQVINDKISDSNFPLPGL